MVISANPSSAVYLKAICMEAGTRVTWGRRYIRQCRCRVRALRRISQQGLQGSVGSVWEAMLGDRESSAAAAAWAEAIVESGVARFLPVE